MPLKRYAEAGDGFEEEKVIVVYIPGLHESLAGIVAAKLKEKYYRPAIVFTDSATGSGRFTRAPQEELTAIILPQSLRR